MLSYLILLENEYEGGMDGVVDISFNILVI